MLGVFVHLLADLLCHSTDGQRALHVSIIWIGSWLESGIVMDDAIVIKIIAQFFFELNQQARRDQCCGSCINAFLTL